MEMQLNQYLKLAVIPWIYCGNYLVYAQSNTQLKLSNQFRWSVTDSSHLATFKPASSTPFNTQFGYSVSATGNLFIDATKNKSPNIKYKKFNRENGPISWGMFIETDPGEALNKPDFFRAFVKIKPINKQSIVKQCVWGSFQMQIGEGLTKSNASGFWSSNQLWASKLTDWQLSEKRGFNEGRNPQGAAAEFHLHSWQAMAAAAISLNDATSQYFQINVPKTTQFSPDTLGQYFSSINLSGQHLDANSLIKKHNLRELQYTLALKKQKLFLDTNTPLFRAYSIGLASHFYQFSIPYAWEKPSPNNSFSSLSKQFLYLESFASLYLNQGDMLFFHLSLLNPINHCSYPPNSLLKNFSAFSAGYTIPLGKDNDFSIRYYRIAPLYFAFDGLNNRLLRSTQNITVTSKNNLSTWATLQTILPIYQKLQYNPIANSPNWIFQPEIRTICKLSKSQLAIALKTVLSPYQEINPLWQLQQVINNSYPNWESYFANNLTLASDFTELYPKNGDLKFHLQWLQTLKNNSLQVSFQGIQSGFFQTQSSAFPTLISNLTTPLNQSVYAITYIKKPMQNNQPSLELGLQLFDSNNGLLVGGCQILHVNTPQYVKGSGLALHYAAKWKFHRNNQFGLHFQLVFQQVSNTPVSGRIFVTLWQL